MPPQRRFSWPRSLAAAVRSLKPQGEDPRDKPPQKKSADRQRLARALALGALLAGSALAVGILKLPESPTPATVSGSARLKLSDAGEFVRWRKQATELTVDPSFEQLGSGARDVVALAYATWSSERAHLPALTIDLASTPRRAERDGVNLVTYAPIEIAGHTQSLGVTVAYLLADGTITEVDTIINSRKPFQVIAERGPAVDAPAEHPADDHDHDRDDWADHDGPDHDGPDHGGRDHDGPDHDRDSDVDDGQTRVGAGDCRQSYDLQSVLAHEAGHFFGLGEDEENREATMYYKTARCDTKQRDLTEDDVAAVETVYAEPAPAEGGDVNQAAACAMAPGPGPRPLAWTLIALLGTLRAARRVRGRRA